MPTFQERVTWLKDVVEEPIESFADHFKMDLSDYLSLESIDSKSLRLLLGNRWSQFELCDSKDDVRAFVSELTGTIVLRLDTESIIQDIL